MAMNYVKFIRGTPEAFKKLTAKDKDTLYFISETDSQQGSLYLGNKIISESITSLEDLSNILIEDLQDNHLLSYDADNQIWTNKSIIEAIGIMAGSTFDTQGGAGLVPAPGIGQHELFLRGDGTWASPVSTIQLFSDNKTIETINGHTLSLKNFGKQYYKYVAATGNVGEDDYVASSYVSQIVDADHPWKQGLEPKVIEENGEFVLGWFEPNPTTVDGLVDELTSLQSQINGVSQNIANNKGSIDTLTIQINSLNKDIEKKANAADVYTKTETELKIEEAVVNSQHLKRKTFTSLEEAKTFTSTITDPENYIYMIGNTSSIIDDKYDEYLYIEGNLEKVGSWDVNLDNYVTDTEFVTALSGKVDVREGYDLISNEEKTKLENIEDGAQKNFITSVETTEFNVDENGKLNLIEISVSKVSNLENLLNNKVDTNAVQTLQISVNNLSTDVNNLSTSVSSLSDLIGNYDNRISNIEDKLETYVLKSAYDTDQAIIMNSITWKELI